MDSHRCNGNRHREFIRVTLFLIYNSGEFINTRLMERFRLISIAMCGRKVLFKWPICEFVARLCLGSGRVSHHLQMPHIINTSPITPGIYVLRSLEQQTRLPWREV